MKEEILAGTVPVFFGNAVLPVFDPDGDIWLILNGEGQLDDTEGMPSIDELNGAAWPFPSRTPHHVPVVAGMHQVAR